MGGFLVVWLLLALGVGVLATDRGRSGFGFFLLSILLSPLLGLIVLLVSRNVKAEEETDRLRREEHERQLASIKALAPAAASAGKVASVADEIEKLASLRDRGALTEAEFASQKAMLLSGKR